MITESFYRNSEALIHPVRKDTAKKVDALIVTFSYQIEEYLVNTFHTEIIGHSYSVTGRLPIYTFKYNEKTFAFIKSYVGAPACTATIEDTMIEVDTDKIILFGGSGCLNKEYARGKVMVPLSGYRDEGTSFHYMPPSDYLDIPNGKIVSEFMEIAGLPYAVGKTWTTDAMFRETREEIEKHKKDGCISVEMESTGVQAMCTFRGYELFVFFTCGDLLDAPKWDMRMEKGQIKDTQHDPGHLLIALELADYVTNSNL